MRSVARVIVHHLITCMVIFAVTSLAVAQEAPPQDIAPFGHTVVGIDGQVEFHRSQWDESVFVPLALGEILFDGDIVDPLGPSTVLIECGGESTMAGEIVLVSGPPSPPACTPFDPDAMMGENIVSGTGGDRLLDVLLGEDQRGAEVLQIFLPRGLIADTMPQFRWREVENAVSYRVEVRRDSADGVLVWAETVEARRTRTIYPPAEVPLTQGEYVIFVTPLNENGQPLRGVTPADALIQVISPERVSEIEANKARRNNQGLQQDMSIFLLAQDFARDSLFVDAIKTLENLLAISPLDGTVSASNAAAKSIGDSPITYIRLGTWYQAIGLPDVAKAIYRHALHLATDQSLTSSEMTARVVLGSLGVESFREQYCLVKPALDFYLSVGDQSSIYVQNAQRLVDEAVKRLQLVPTCL